MDDDELHKIANDWAFEQCPRCLGQLRKSVNDRGAWSRTDRDNDDMPALIVCGRCGDDEATRQALAGLLVPQDDWPMLDDPHQYATPAR